MRELFDQWRTLTIDHTHEVKVADVDAFCSGLSFSKRTTQRVRRELIRSNGLFEEPAETHSHVPVLIEGENTLLGDALAGCREARWPNSMRGRRDAWLLVLLAPYDQGGVRLTRSGAIEAAPEDVHFSEAGVFTCDEPVGLAELPDRCPSCAVVRWVEALNEYLKWYRSGAASLSMKPEDGHVCSRRPSVPPSALAPPIDRHGWVSTDLSLTPRSVTAIVASRVIVTVQQDEAHQQAQAPPTPALDVDEVTRQADEVNARISQMLDEAEDELWRIFGTRP